MVKNRRPKQGASQPPTTTDENKRNEGHTAVPMSRKERRKLERQTQKQKKQVQYQKHQQTKSTASNKRPSSSVEHADTTTDTATEKAHHGPPTQKRRKNKASASSRQVSTANKPGNVNGTAAGSENEEDSDPEDAEIRYLEKKLGLRDGGGKKQANLDKSKKLLKKEFVKDGFDEGFLSFLDQLDNIGSGGLATSDKESDLEGKIETDQEDESDMNSETSEEDYDDDEIEGGDEEVETEGTTSSEDENHDGVEQHQNESEEEEQSDQSDDELDEQKNKLGAGEENRGADSSDTADEHDDKMEGTKTAYDDAVARRRAKYEQLYGEAGPSHAHEELGITEESMKKRKEQKANKEIDQAQAAASTVAAAAGGNAKYVPPALRKKQGSGGDDLMRLTKRVQGLLNRLAEANIEPIAKEIAGIYDNHGKGHVNGVLIACVLEMCAQTKQLAQNIIMVYAGLISALHIYVGHSVGAYVAEKISHRLQSILNLPTSLKEEVATDDGAKEYDINEARNLVHLLSYIYIFNIVSSKLILDIATLLSRRFLESDVELILVIIKFTGWQLRSDDPAGLKDAISVIQKRAKDFGATIELASKKKSAVVSREPHEGNDGETSISMRLQVMLEIIMDIKNNRKRQSHEQLLERGTTLKKWLSKLGTQKASEVGDRTVRAGWEDFMNIQSRGRWWLVGSTWTGISSEDQRNTSAATSNEQELAGGLTIRSEEAQLLELARKQRMNTAVRRSVFVALMGADSPDSALERLLKLNLKGSAEREIVRVLVDCCGQESVFNPFYAVVGRKLCEERSSFKFTFQLSLWDSIKLLDEYETRKIYNLARLLAYLISNFSLSIAVLKVFDFTCLSQKSLLFLRACVGSVLQSCDNDVVLRAVFTRCGNSKDTSLIRDGLGLFLSKYMKAHIATTYENNKEKKRMLRSRLKTARQALDNVIVKDEDDLVA